MSKENKKYFKKLKKLKKEIKKIFKKYQIHTNYEGLKEIVKKPLEQQDCESAGLSEPKASRYIELGEPKASRYLRQKGE